MGLKNFTTQIEVEKTMAEIEKILAKHGATHIYKMYDDKGVPKALAFKTTVRERDVAFKLPMNEDKIMTVFKNEVSKGVIPKKYWDDREQARRTGWRIIKDWVDSQMALLEIELVKFEEVFLPYMYNQEKDKTLFELMEEKNFMLEDKR